MVEEAKKGKCQHFLSTHSIAFHPYKILQGKFHDLQFGNIKTKAQRRKVAFPRAQSSPTPGPSYINTQAGQEAASSGH